MKESARAADTGSDNRLDLTDTCLEQCKRYEYVGLSKPTLKTDLIGFIGFRTGTKGLATGQMYSEQDRFDKS